jgi:hypothetical protein
MKKIIASFLCTALAICSIPVASAETTSIPTYKSLGTTTIPNNTVRLYTYGLTETNTYDSAINYYSRDNDTDNCLYAKNSIGKYQSMKLKDSGYIRQLQTKDSSGYNIYDNDNFDHTGGTYEKIRIKLSDFSSYFNSDGTHTATLNNQTHNFNFTDEGDGYISSLMIISGGAVTAVAPNKNGYAEFYVCKNIGEKTEFITDFSVVTSSSVSGGGGTTGSRIEYLKIGDVDLSSIVDISDVSAIQKYLVDIETLDSKLAIRNADANGDGNIDINDATAIQKYLVGLS